MRKYVYDNATVYITEPTEAQLQNIRESTKRFVTRLAAKGLIGDEYKRDYRGVGGANTNARSRTKKAKQKARTH